MSIRTDNVDKSNEIEWENYLYEKQETTFVDDKKWFDLIDRHFRFPQFRTIIKNGKEVDGTLSLAMANHPIFGKYLATAPFANYGGLYFDSDQSMNRLIKYSESVMANENAEYVVLRHIHNKQALPDGWKSNNIYATYIVDLRKGSDDIFQHSIKKNARRDVNKAIREGFTIKFGRHELVDDFWNLITRSMRELGSPYHSKKYINQLLDIWDQDAELGVAYAKNGDPFGCCLIMFHKDTAVLLHANTLYDYRSMCAGDFLYWSVIEECSKRGYSQLDLGRSLIGSGNETFKMKWKPNVYPLQYWYYLKKGESLPNLNQSNPRYELPRKIWQKLPLFLHRKAGPYLISGIL